MKIGKIYRMGGVHGTRFTVPITNLSRLLGTHANPRKESVKCELFLTLHFAPSLPAMPLASKQAGRHFAFELVARPSITPNLVLTCDICKIVDFIKNSVGLTVTP